MGMTDILYIDIDGTLRDERNGIPESSGRALELCRDKGIQIVICTGRNRGSIQDDVKALKTDGVISAGGCDIRFGKKLLKQEHFSEKAVKKFLKVAAGQELGVSFEAEEEIYMNRKAALFYREDFLKKTRGCPDTEKIRRENKIRYEDNLSRLWTVPWKIHKVCLIGSEEQISQIEKEAGKQMEVVQKTQWNGQFYMELLPAGCGKGAAVEFLNHYLHIEKENSMSFGNGDNDVEMLRACGTGIAVRGCGPKLLKYADSICGPPGEDGIYKELLRRNMIEV